MKGLYIRSTHIWQVRESLKEDINAEWIANFVVWASSCWFKSSVFFERSSVFNADTKGAGSTSLSLPLREGEDEVEPPFVCDYQISTGRTTVSILQRTFWVTCECGVSQGAILESSSSSLSTTLLCFPRWPLRY